MHISLQISFLCSHSGLGRLCVFSSFLPPQRLLPFKSKPFELNLIWDKDIIGLGIRLDDLLGYLNQRSQLGHWLTKIRMSARQTFSVAIYFKVKHFIGHISGMFDAIGEKWKIIASAWEKFGTLTVDLTHELDIRFFKIKFRNSCNCNQFWQYSPQSYYFIISVKCYTNHVLCHRHYIW